MLLFNLQPLAERSMKVKQIKFEAIKEIDRAFPLAKKTIEVSSRFVATVNLTLMY